MLVNQKGVVQMKFLCLLLIGIEEIGRPQPAESIIVVAIIRTLGLEFNLIRNWVKFELLFL